MGRTATVMAAAMVILAAMAYQQSYFGESLKFNAVMFLAWSTALNWDHLQLPGITIEEQLAVLGPFRQSGEDVMNTAVSPHSARFLFGEEIFMAATSTATRVVRLEFPGRDDPSVVVPVTCVVPVACDDAPYPLVIWSHSGGMVTGSVTAEMAHCHHLAQRLPAVVCSVEYRLSPEHVYPAAIEDGRDAALGLLKLTTIGGCDVDTGNVATAGFSAGGYMAANIARALAYSGVTPTVQVSVCPMAKPFGGTASEAAQADSPIWPRAANQYAWSAFLRGQPAAAASWSANLLVDPPEQVIERLPPTYVQVMTLDTLRDEGAEYAARLADLGKLIAIDEFNTTHIGFLSGIAKGGNAEAAWPKVVAVLKRYLHPTAE